MKLDLLAAIGLTACAAVAISALAIGLGQSPTARVRLAALFFGWFLLVTVLAAADALHYQHGTGILGLGAAVVLPLAILFITGLRSAAAQRAMLAIPLWLLIGVNSIRVLGVFFVILHAAGRLPALLLQPRAGVILWWVSLPGRSHGLRLEGCQWHARQSGSGMSLGW